MPPGYYCRVLYDVRTATPPYGVVGLGLLLCVAGALVAVDGSFPARSGRPASPFRRWLTFGFAVLWTSVMTCGFVIEPYALRRALNEGRTMHVEGYITEFNAVGRGMKGQESFVVDHLRFSDFDLGRGSAGTSQHGGPLMAGSYVRIEAVDSHIARLELCAP